MKKLNEKLLKDILLDKDWKENQDIIDLLVKKGASIGAKEHIKFLKLETEKFKQIIKYFNFDNVKEEFPLFYYIVNMTDDERTNEKINENLVNLFKMDKKILFIDEDMFTQSNEKVKIYKNILNILIEEGNSLLISKLIDENIIIKEDFVTNKINILKSIAMSFIRDYRIDDNDKNHINIIDLLLKKEMLEKQEVNDAVLSVFGRSFTFTRGSNNSLSSILANINHDLNRIEKLGLLPYFKEENNIKNEQFKSLEEKIIKELNNRIVMINDLKQGNGIYSDTIKEFINIAEQILLIEEKRKKFNLEKTTLGLDEIIKEYESIILDFSHRKEKVADFNANQYEQNMKNIMIKIRATIIDNELKEPSQIIANKKAKI